MIRTDALTGLFSETRKQTENICGPLTPEDHVVQPIGYVSPPKWHLGHSSWFFEEFILKPHKEGYREFNRKFSYLFNSYYETVGDRVARTDRGNITRPGVKEIMAYRSHITHEMDDLLRAGPREEIRELIEIGIHHEKQHQELLLTDIKYILGHNPLYPPYRKDFNEDLVEEGKQQWIGFKEGVYEVGHGDNTFCYDNELGRHKVYLGDYELSSRLVTNADYLEFMEDNGYGDHRYWHAEGLEWLRNVQIDAPMYWRKYNGQWYHYTLCGFRKVNPKAVLTHISYYEAFAFAQWKGMRLPTEFEWEAAQEKIEWGQRWEWTESAYLPYPGFKAAEGALGEYNGKFMVNQKVLRGGSIATPPKHTRPTYRNFFHPHLRWQFNAIRLAR